MPLSSTQTELRWYYAVDDAHVGPVSASRFWQLADEGVIKADTLVWCTGYSDWVPAKTVEGLFRGKKNGGSDHGFVAHGPHTLSPTPMKPPPPEEPDEIDVTLLMQIAKSGILLGLVCIVFSRGCDQVDQARLDGISGKLEISQHEFSAKEAARIGPLKDRVEQLSSINYASAADKKNLEEATDALKSEKIVMISERQKIEEKTWAPLRAEEARITSDFKEIQVFRRIAGLLGTTLTLIGLGIALFYAPSNQQLGIWIVLGVVIAAAYLA